MDGKSIIDSLAEGNISSLSEDVEAYLKLAPKNAQKILAFIPKFFKQVLEYLKPMQSLPPKEQQNVTCSIISCLEWLKKNHTLDVSSTQVECLLYYIIDGYLNVKCLEEAMKFASYLRFLLNVHSDLPSRKTKLETVAYNIIFIFSKAATELEKQLDQSSKYSMALQLRATAILFCSMAPEGTQNLGSKILHFLQRYHDEKNQEFDPECIVTFLNTVWHGILSESSSRTVSLSQKFMYFQVIHKCDTYLAKRPNYQAISAHFPKWLRSLKTLKCEAVNSPDATSLLAVSVDLSVSYFELPVPQKSVPLALLSEWNKLVNAELWSEQEMEIIYLMCSFVFTRVFVSILEQTKDDVRLEYIAVAQEMATAFSSLFSTSNAYSPDSMVQYNSVTGIGNLGIICYTKNMYEEAIPFFKISIDLQLSGDCGTDMDESLWKKMHLLIYCYTTTGKHMEALTTVAKAFSLRKHMLSNCVKFWLKAKRSAHCSAKNESIAKTTICDIAKQHKIQLSNEDCLRFLMHEIRLCNFERRNIGDECSAVISWLLRLCPKGLERACALVLQVEYHITHQVESLHTSALSLMDDMCQEALKIFENHLVENPNDVSVKLNLSVLYFWMYHVKWMKQQEIAKEEIEKPIEVLVPDEDNSAGHAAEEKDKNDKCNVTTRFASVTALAEMQLLAILNKAVTIWLEFSYSKDMPWSKVLDLVQELNLLNIVKATARYFAQSANDYSELHTLIVLRDLAKAAANQSLELTALHSILSLVTRLGYLKMAGIIVSYVELNLLTDVNSKDDFFHTEKLKFYLAKSYYFLQSEQFHPGLELLLRILKDPFLELNQRMSMFLKAEAQLLSSMYLLLPPAAFSYDNVPSIHFPKDTPIRLAVESLKNALRLVKFQSKVPEKKSSYGTDLSYTPELFCLLMRCTVLVGKLYAEIGAPREARCFLQECLLLSQKFILTYWSSKFLITLAHVDLLCDNLEDCEVKLSGLKHMLNTSSRAAVVTSVPPRKSAFNATPSIEREPSPDSDFLNTRSGRSRKGWIRQQLIKSETSVMSPVIKWQTKRDDNGILTHPESCVCQYCEFYALQVINLETAALSCQYLLAKGDSVEAGIELDKVLKAHKRVTQNSIISKAFHLITDTSVPDAGVKVLRESDLSVFVSSVINLSKISMEQGDCSAALSHIAVALDKLNSCAKYSKHLFGNLYGSLVYCKIVTLVRILTTSKLLMKSPCLANTWFGKRNNPVNLIIPELLDEFSKLSVGCETPKDRKLPIIEIRDLSDIPYGQPSSSAQLCKAPMKRDLLSSAMKNCLSAMDISPSTPFCLDYSNSGDDCAFISPSNSESDFKECEKRNATSSRKIRSSATKGKAKKPSKARTTSTPPTAAQSVKKRNLSRNVKRLAPGKSDSKVPSSKSNSSPEIVFKFFKSKCGVDIKSSEDIWSQTLDDFKGNHLSASNSSKKKKVRAKVPAGKTALLTSAPRRSARTRSNGIPDADDTFASPPADRPKIASRRVTSKSKSGLVVCPSDEQQQAGKSDDRSTVEKARGIGVPLSKVKCSNKKGILCDSVSEEFCEKEEAKFSITRSSVSEPYTPKFVGVPYEQNYSTKASLTEIANLDFGNIAAVKVEELIFELKEAMSLLEHHPPCPLYANMCILLALLSSNKTLENSDKDHENKRDICYLISESFAVTLRHQSIIRLSKLMRDPPENCKDDKKAVLPPSEAESLLKANTSRQSNLNFSKWMANHSFSDRMKQLQSVLPAEWTVVQVHAFPEILNTSKSTSKPHAPKLVVCQYRRDSPPCVSVIDNDADPLFATNFLSLFETIIRESCLTMTNRDAKAWWTLRGSLDNQMKELTESMENVWLGCWKGLFLGLPSSKERMQQLCKAVLQVTSHAQSLGCFHVDKELLKVILDSASHLSNQQLSTAVLQLWNLSPADPVLPDLTKYILSLSASFSAAKRNPVLLILDKHVQALPWESMPLLRDVPVTRVPSVALLNAQLESFSVLESPVFSNGVQTEKTFYVLNPAGDLLQTQETFQDIFKQQKGWKGILGRAPTSEEFRSAVTDYDLFLYLGHGTGKMYLSGECLEKYRCQAASLLMGCSSGRLKLLGRQLEPAGVVLQYFLGGSPCIVGNLWDVTDKDIDRFTQTLLETWLPNYGKNTEPLVNVATAISIARSACKLPFLIGAAPVVYGLPIFTKS